MFFSLLGPYLPSIQLLFYVLGIHGVGAGFLNAFLAVVLGSVQWWAQYSVSVMPFWDGQWPVLSSLFVDLLLTSAVLPFLTCIIVGTLVMHELFSAAQLKDYSGSFSLKSIIRAPLLSHSAVPPPPSRTLVMLLEPENLLIRRDLHTLQRTFLRALLFALITVSIALIPVTLLCVCSPWSSLPVGRAILMKGLFSGLLAFFVEPIVAYCALSSRMPQIQLPDEMSASAVGLAISEEISREN